MRYIHRCSLVLLPPLSALPYTSPEQIQGLPGNKHGPCLAKLERFEEAVRAYEQALALDATYAAAYTGLSSALLQLGRTQEAAQASTRAKQLGEEDEALPSQAIHCSAS